MAYVGGLIVDTKIPVVFIPVGALFMVKVKSALVDSIDETEVIVIDGKTTVVNVNSFP